MNHVAQLTSDKSRISRVPLPFFSSFFSSAPIFIDTMGLVPNSRCQQCGNLNLACNRDLFCATAYSEKHFVIEIQVLREVAFKASLSLSFDVQSHLCRKVLKSVSYELYTVQVLAFQPSSDEIVQPWDWRPLRGPDFLQVPGVLTSRELRDLRLNSLVAFSAKRRQFILSEKGAPCLLMKFT